MLSKALRMCIACVIRVRGGGRGGMGGGPCGWRGGWGFGRGCGCGRGGVAGERGWSCGVMSKV